MNRKQFVVFDNSNDLHYVSDQLTLILCADDTNIFISGNSVQQLNFVLNQELAKVGDWFSANRLIVNMKKIIWSSRVEMLHIIWMIYMCS